MASKGSPHPERDLGLDPGEQSPFEKRRYTAVPQETHLPKIQPQGGY
jgi:hypothetical protein